MTIPRRRAVMGLGLAAALLFVAATFKPVVENDGVGYFVYLHSVVIDHDLDFSDEYAAAGAAHVAFYPSLLETRTSTGLVADFFPVGPALLSLPAYLVAVAANRSPEPPFAAPFTVAFTLSSLLYGLLALALTYRLAAAVTGARGAALAGTAGALVATPLLYYLLYEPSYSHTFSAFAVAAFLYVWWAGRDTRRTRGWLLLGLLGGLMALTRWQDGPLLAIALLDLPRARWRVLLLAPGAVLAFLPQVGADAILFGTLLPVRPAGQDLQPLPGHYLEVLLSSHHGLFTWTPLYLAAVAGFAFVRDRGLQVAFVYAFVVETAINGAAPDWWGGYAFGMRRFLDLTPFFGLGLAALAARVGTRPAWAAIGVAGAWNLLLIASLTYVMRADVDPGFGGLLADQARAVRYLPNLFAQGAVVRELALWPLLRQPFQPLGGAVLLLLEAACLLVAAALGGRRSPADSIVDA